MSATLLAAFAIWAGGSTGVTAPSITSFSPAHAVAGQIVTIRGSGFQSVGNVVFSEHAESREVAIISPNVVRAKVPPTARSGPLEVRTGHGNARSERWFFPLPVITSFSPAEAAAGMSITIRGTNLAPARVVFAGADYETQPSYQSWDWVTVRVPASARSGRLEVKNGAGTAKSESAFTAVRVDDFDPKRARFGDTVTITGSGLERTSSVRFGNARAAFTASAGAIRAVVPPEAADEKIVVTAAGAELKTSTEFLPLPGIERLSHTAILPGGQLAIFGGGLAHVQSVKFAGAYATQPFERTPTRITVNVPADAATGKVRVIAAAGSAKTEAVLTILPRVRQLSSVEATPGSTITVSGGGFEHVASVRFGALAASFDVKDRTRIDARVPADALTDYVTVTTSAGSAMSAERVRVQPRIDEFAPKNGPPGTVVTLTGAGFRNVSGVAFGPQLSTAPRASFALVSSTVLRAVVPAGAETGNLWLLTDAGGRGLGTFRVPPVVAGFQPAVGVVGAHVTITGSGFRGATVVTFGGARAPYTILSPTEVDAVVPPDARSGPVAITTDSGTTDSRSMFGIVAVISSFTPGIGPPGTATVITGSGLVDVRTVLFNERPATFVVFADRSRANLLFIRATVPSSATTGRITLLTGGGRTESVAAFTVTPARQLTNS